MTMIRKGRIHLDPAEHKAVEKLLFENDGASVSLTRRDPDETGPVLVHVGDVTYQIDPAGHRKKANG